MKACQPKISAFKSSKESLLSYRPITHCDYQQNLIPIKKWAEANNYSYKQARNLVKKKLLIAKKHKGKWYVASPPIFNQQII